MQAGAAQHHLLFQTHRPLFMGLQTLVFSSVSQDYVQPGSLVDLILYDFCMYPL